MTQLKLAVIGAGHLGKIHARLLSEMADVELVGVVDTVAAARESVAADCRTRALENHRALLDCVDGVVVAVPTRYHHAVALDFLRRGLPVLVEKPLASTLAEADELVMASQHHGAILQVGHIERFNPAFVAAQARVAQPRYIEAVRASGYTGRSTDIGVVQDLMIHDLDLLLSLVDAPLRSVSAIGMAVLGQHEDVAQARLEFANGCIAHLSASRVSFSPTPKRQMQIWSARGFAAIDFGSRSVQVVCPSAEVRNRAIDFNALSAEEKTGLKERLFRDVLPVETLEIEPRNAIHDELRDFCASIRQRSAPRVGGEAGRNAVAAAEAILGSIAAHDWFGEDGNQFGPLTPMQPSILRGPHWHLAPQRSSFRRREAG